MTRVSRDEVLTTTCPRDCGCNRSDAGHDLQYGRVALRYVYGTSVDGFDPRAARDAACIADRRLAEGETALVHNSCGRLDLKVTMSDHMPRGVALAHKGRWLATDVKRANVNVLKPGQESDMGESTAVHSVEAIVQCAPRVPAAP